ncbi:MAG: DUF721 domain-containing protein [Prevotellaceae bacterium]|jgi:hypothetical protein|nr:DUF721 domain-containing protein [Prevotellaceae bacterium]
MERINPEKAEKAIKLFVKQLGLESGFKQYRIMKMFNEMAGESVVKHIKKKTLRERKLFVFFDSSVARNQIFMQRTAIIQNINQQYGEYILEEIILK